MVATEKVTTNDNAIKTLHNPNIIHDISYKSSVLCSSKLFLTLCFRLFNYTGRKRNFMLQTKAYKVIIYILKIFVYRNVVLIYFLHTPNKDLEQGPS